MQDHNPHYEGMNTLPLERWGKFLLQGAVLPLFSDEHGIGVLTPQSRLGITLLKSLANPNILRLIILVFTLP